jgi:hypothetical protein
METFFCVVKYACVQVQKQITSGGIWVAIWITGRSSRTESWPTAALNFGAFTGPNCVSFLPAFFTTTAEMQDGDHQSRVDHHFHCHRLPKELVCDWSWGKHSRLMHQTVPCLHAGKRLTLESEIPISSTRFAALLRIFQFHLHSLSSKFSQSALHNNNDHEVRLC